MIVILLYALHVKFAKNGGESSAEGGGCPLGFVQNVTRLNEN